jgi:hypothetical protein
MLRVHAQQLLVGGVFYLIPHYKTIKETKGERFHYFSETWPKQMQSQSTTLLLIVYLPSLMSELQMFVPILG